MVSTDQISCQYHFDNEKFVLKKIVLFFETEKKRRLIEVDGRLCSYGFGSDLVFLLFVCYINTSAGSSSSIGKKY